MIAQDPQQMDAYHGAHGLSRRTDKNVGVSWFKIPVRLRQMLGDVRAQIEHQAYSPVEIAARYHHRLVTIQDSN
jgi:fido (protein-threonine AMPylation protein)